MAKPMRRFVEGFGSDPWISRTWCNDISPGFNGNSTALLSSTFHHDLLAAAEQIISGESVTVGNLVQLMRSGNDSHRPVLVNALAKGNPGRNNIGWLQSPVCRILMPRNEAGIPRLLDKKAAAPNQNIRADYLFDRVKHARMTDKFVKPGQKQMRLVAEAAGQPAVVSLKGFEAAKQIRRRRQWSRPGLERNSLGR